ncbi:Uncharacterized protein dnm_069890 [Desulfonema magnum]|uniref:Uncharacterized protein n=1 Tax=Desulfonema magnum TaxID=45655 RepID=A0A975GRH6_9BACT|nr:Uncharacterized protein dnm_069890 [Desulfonema magnum]
MDMPLTKSEKKSGSDQFLILPFRNAWISGLLSDELKSDHYPCSEQL